MDNDGEPVHGICLYMPCTGKEYAKGKGSGKCKESLFDWSTEEGWWFRKEFRDSQWIFVNCDAQSHCYL